MRSDVHIVAMDDDLVLLDIRADRYVCIPGGAGAVSVGRDGEVEFLHTGAAQLFHDAGFLAGSDSTWARLEDGPARPVRSWDDGASPPRIGVRRAVDMVSAASDSFLNYRGRSFGSILAHAARGARPGPPTITEDLLQRVRQFHREAIWIPTPGKCLARSFVLLSFLRRSGLDARWVIAVRTWPFAAHCWLQVEDMVLDDYPERVAAFAPICCV
ncbi:lasso peptide biosynthesis B2 protein [Phenylobacterium sp.]|uniref:lasso peptide biosynthesis B2 protein n=1 Tax=Phenylobacterium sp. TaxID=1871053 RepID=UPI002E326CFB|nr:lasso peptide biosynthesis B2 protein [Phenylobacterium sp.]HEX3365705.1 lasso peptide biosynthesis B2 protein [Phenylobacterium sp.]